MKPSFSNHLVQLLYSNDCVIVPNFGGFLTERVSARIHPVSHRFLPPSKSVLFNSRLEKNDGLLANAISRSEDIPYKQALKKLIKEVKKCQKALANGETIELEQLGKLSKGLEGNISFIHSEDLNLLPESYGLTEFRSNFVLREESKETKEKLYASASELEEIKVRNKEVKVQKWWFAAAAAAVVVSVGVYGMINQDQAKDFYRNYAYLNPFKSIPTQTYEPRTERINPFNQIEELQLPGVEAMEFPTALESTPKVEAKADLEENIEPESIPAVAEKKEVKAEPEIILKPESVPTVKPKATSPASNRSTAVNSAEAAKYVIVAGAFGELENANKMEAKLKSQGYNALNFKYGSKGMNFVAYEGFKTSAEASQALKKIRLTAPDAWVMRK